MYAAILGKHRSKENNLPLQRAHSIPPPPLRPKRTPTHTHTCVVSLLLGGVCMPDRESCLRYGDAACRSSASPHADESSSDCTAASPLAWPSCWAPVGLSAQSRAAELCVCCPVTLGRMLTCADLLPGKECEEETGRLMRNCSTGFLSEKRGLGMRDPAGRKRQERGGCPCKGTPSRQLPDRWYPLYSGEIKQGMMICFRSSAHICEIPRDRLAPHTWQAHIGADAVEAGLAVLRVQNRIRLLILHGRQGTVVPPLLVHIPAGSHQPRINVSQSLHTQDLRPSLSLVLSSSGSSACPRTLQITEHASNLL